MNCPKCNNAIVSAGSNCNLCGYAYSEELFAKLTVYFGMKNELDRLNKLQDSLYAGIANVTLKIKKYEEVLLRELNKANIPPARRKSKAAVRKKNKRR